MKWPDDFVNKIICGDCLEIMKQIPDESIELILTDPPYGIEMDKGFSGYGGFPGKGKIARRRYKIRWDNQRPSREYFEELLRIGRKVLVFGGNFFADLLPRGTHWVVWDKLNTMPSFGDCELIWTNINRKSVKKIVFEYNGLIGKEEWRAHPTQKPLGLIIKLIDEYSQENDIVLDPFLGSGTTAVACKRLRRKFIGIEINPEYCEIAEERLAQEVLPF